MDHFAGLDVSVNETSICIVDDAGKIVREVKVASELEALTPMTMSPSSRPRERVTIFVLLTRQCDLDCVVRLQKRVLRVFARIGNRNVIQSDAALCY